MVDNIRLKVYHNIVVMYLRQTFPSFITLLVWLGFLYLLDVLYISHCVPNFQPMCYSDLKYISL